MLSAACGECVRGDGLYEKCVSVWCCYFLATALFESGGGEDCSLLAGLTIGCVLKIYLLFHYGEALRKSSLLLSGDFWFK